MSATKKATRKQVYTVDPAGKFRVIGVAFVNADNSLDVVLDVFPVNGRLHIREEKTPNNK